MESALYGGEASYSVLSYLLRWHGLCSIALQMALKVKGLQVDTLQEEVQQISVDMKRTQKVVHYI